MTSPTKFHHMTQIILYMWSCDQSYVTVARLWEKLSQPQFYKDKPETKKPFILRNVLDSSSINWDWKKVWPWNFTPV